MSTTWRICALLLLSLSCLEMIKAQDRPQALLRTNEEITAPANQRYYIEVLTDTKLKQSDYDAFQGANPPALGVLASKGIPVSGVGALVPAPGNDRTRFRIYLDESFKPFMNFADKKFSVILTNFKDDSDRNQIRSIAVQRVFTPEFATDFAVCRPNHFSMRFEYAKGEPYSFGKAQEFYQALDQLRNTPANLARIEIKVEPLSKTKVSTIGVTALRLYPDRMEHLGTNNTLTACFETNKDLPSEKFDADVTWNTPVPLEFLEPHLVLGLEGRAPEASPVVFVDKEKAVGVRPIEKDLNLAFSAVSKVEDEEQPDKTTIRKRKNQGTLDLRLGLFRKTERLTVKGLIDGGRLKPQKICGRVGDFTPASTNATGKIVINGVTWGIARGIDLKTVKKDTDQCLHFLYSDGADAEGNSVIGDHNTFPNAGASDPMFTPYVGPLEQPDLTAGTYSIFTPFYLDAKISTGKIETDTLSLNRVVFGIQEEFRYFQNNFRFPTYYRFVFQGNHASDRDFKQKEYKGTFEFRPIFGPLNHPFDASNSSSSKRVLCPGCKQGFKLIPSNRGYEFVPLIGVELGRTYSRRNPAPDIKPSDTVKRIYFGLDIVLNPTSRVELKATDQFYIRGESKTDRYHNYFSSEISYRLANFFHARAAHSIFLSWEKGGQPPFEDADVNVVKFGYRVTAATLFSR